MNLGKKAKLIYKPMQSGDVPNTLAGIEKAKSLLGFVPSTPFDKGIGDFVSWYLARQNFRPHQGPDPARYPNLF
ncbi:MAG: hypothetical protein K2X93_08550 [Candidatus Obscuribacterales bacterium]|nr:hypothetical protein [Candidatus Obscuribacterales bacterium]